jgi:diguanylate cyclase (GGDEF)-like protein/PAS domain S-box-containing protein
VKALYLNGLERRLVRNHFRPRRYTLKNQPSTLREVTVAGLDTNAGPDSSSPANSPSPPPRIPRWVGSWFSPILLAGAFLLVVGALLWRVHVDRTLSEQQGLADSALAAQESLRLRLRGNEDYLLLLASERARGSLGPESFQQRVGIYVEAHAELINVTWVDASYVIRDVAPLAGNRQIVGLTLDLPEPKRVARLARERRAPVYTRPFEAIQGRPSFEVWVPVFRGDEFIGLFAGVYSCAQLLQQAIPEKLLRRHHFELKDSAGSLLGESPQTATLQPGLVREVELSPPGQGVVLRLQSYDSGAEHGRLLLEALCAALALGMVYSLWALKRDIDHRRRSERELRTSEERWKFALEGAGDGVWDWDIPSGEILYSKRYKEMMGFRDEEAGHRVEDWETWIHPDSKAQVAAQMQTCLKGEVPSFSAEFRLRRNDGSWIWVLGRGKVVSRDERGNPLRMIGTQADITQRKQAEEQLRLAALVYQHCAEAMTVTDADNNIIAVNAAFTRLTGYEEHEVLGKNPRLLKSGLLDETFYQAMWDAIGTTGHWHGEISDVRKNGEVFVAWLSINTIQSQDGSSQRYVALFSDITEKKKSEDLIWHQANFDRLTKLPNRSMFHDRLAQEIRKTLRDDMPLAVLIIDLDHFKEVNDTLGHDMGDVLLIEAAHRIRACVRESDTVARMGGDEFTVILSQLDGPGGVERVAQDIISALADPFILGEEKAFVSASIGITMFPADATEIEDLLKHADQAMYAAKNLGRNRFCYYTPALQDAAQNRMRLANDLRAALEEQQFMVYYQPIVEMASGRIHKAEALIRWRHPKRGLVSPAEFIPLAEAMGIIVEIGDWVFKEAVRQVKRCRALHDPVFQISVNTSPVQFRVGSGLDQGGFPQVHALDLPGQGIAIEITEGLLLDVAPHVTDTLLACRDLGIQVSLDDFGTGYSSLSYLKKFDIDYLKIDQSFVRNLSPDSDDLTLCEAIIVMAHKLGLKVVAEGVETEAQRDLLAAAGCDFAQGYLFARPLPPEEFEALLTRAACAEAVPHDAG